MEYESQISYGETSKWNQFLNISGVLVSLLVIVFGIISIFDLWSNAISMTETSFSLLMLIHAMEYREKSKKKMVGFVILAIAIFVICILIEAL